MSFKSRLTDDLIHIAAAGGGFRFDGSARLTDDLVRIAAAASRSNARVFISGMSARLSDDLVRIGAAGKGSVVFEDGDFSAYGAIQQLSRSSAQSKRPCKAIQ